MMEQKLAQPAPAPQQPGGQPAPGFPLPQACQAYTSPYQPPQPKPAMQQADQPLFYPSGHPAVYPAGQPPQPKPTLQPADQPLYYPSGQQAVYPAGQLPASPQPGPLILNEGVAVQPSQPPQAVPWQGAEQGPRAPVWATVTAGLLLLFLLLASLLLVVGFPREFQIDSEDSSETYFSSTGEERVRRNQRQRQRDQTMVAYPGDAGDIAVCSLSLVLWQSMVVVQLVVACLQPSLRLLFAAAVAHGIAAFNIIAFLAFSIAMALDADDRFDDAKYYVPSYYECHVVAALAYSLAFGLALTAMAGYATAWRRWREPRSVPNLPVAAPPPESQSPVPQLPGTAGAAQPGVEQKHGQVGQPAQPGEVVQPAAWQGQPLADQPGQKAGGLKAGGKDESLDPGQKEGTKEDSRDPNRKEDTKEESREPTLRKGESRTEDERTMKTDESLGHRRTG